ncbi:MAG: EutN/CcmL family microcompartment protein [Oligoflexia bacterium]|nr:EutN/CcmL family microcompartment protein [Oligoflexia bacterium]
MRLARVVGTVVASTKDKGLQGEKLLVIQPLDEQLNVASDEVVVAVDCVAAGPGDLVFYTLAREATFALKNYNAPVDAAVTGFVDQVNVEVEGKVDNLILE